MNCSTSASTSEACNGENSLLSSCQSLLKRRLELSKADPHSKDEAIISERKEVSAKLSELICGPNGVETLFVAIDQTSDPSFWTTAIACYSLSTIILSVPHRNLFRLLVEIRKLMQDKVWGTKLSLLLASLLEIYEKSFRGKLASATDVAIVDFILRPFERLWEGNHTFLQKSASNAYWDISLDSSLWIAFCWLKHADKMKQLKAHSRLDKLFSVCMVMNGRLPENDSNNFKSTLLDTISGIVGSNGDLSHEKTAKFLVENFIAVSESNLPLFTFSFTKQQMIEVVDKEPSSSKLIFNNVCLDVTSTEDITINLDAYIASLMDFVETMNSKEKGQLLINLWSESIQSWLNFKQDQQWSVGSSKWSSAVGSESQDIEKRRFIAEYLMSGLESLLDTIELDSNSTLKLVHLSKNLISASTAELSDEFDRIRSLDLKAGFDDVMKTKAKTLNLAIGLCGFVLFQDEELSDQTKPLFQELVDLLHSLVELIQNNKQLPIEKLEAVADAAQQILSIATLSDVNPSLPKRQPVRDKKPSGLTECLRVIETDYSDEMDGSIEIAERGHAIITMERRLRNKPQLEIDALDGGLGRVFDALAENLRHPDSYVYLAAINALCELSSWHHKICLPKMMFLLKNWDVQGDDEEDEIEKEANKWNKIRCQVQLGEAIAKVVYSLGDLAPSYFNELSIFFLENAKREDQIVGASALSGLANLILACRGRYFTKIINELIFCCESKLAPTNDSVVRRASVHLLRSIVTSCQIGVFTEIKESSSKITSLLRRTRSNDSDSAVRIHADLALLEIETVLNDILIESLDRNTRVIQ